MKACPNCKETNARIYGRGPLPHVICLCGVIAWADYTPPAPYEGEV
jgi:hypothetical protein